MPLLARIPSGRNVHTIPSYALPRLSVAEAAATVAAAAAAAAASC
jgi:hypothetical protein